jgi:hypothetical protein
LKLQYSIISLAFNLEMSELNGPKRSSGSDAVFPFGPYQGQFSLENLAFNANLQEFTQQAQIIADSYGQGHLDSDGALHQLEQLWQQLKASKHGLGISS